MSNISAIRAEKIPRSDLAIAFTFLNFIKIHPRSFRFAGTLPLRRKALEAVLPPGGYGKAHHVGAAACHTGAARKAGQPECSAYCRGADGKGEHRAHYGGDEKTHDKGAHLSRPHDKVAYNRAYLSDWRGDEHSGKHARQDCYSGGNDQIHRRALGNQLAKEDGYNAHEENGQGTSAAAQRVCRIADGQQRVQHKGRGLHGVSDGRSHGRALHRLGKAVCIRKKAVFVAPQRKAKVKEIGADGTDNGADQERSEQAICHAAQLVYKDALCGKLDVLRLEIDPHFARGSSISVHRFYILLCPAAQDFFRQAAAIYVKAYPRPFSGTAKRSLYRSGGHGSGCAGRSIYRLF